MANRVHWEPGHSVGNEALDAQHRDLLAYCNALADCLAEAGPDGDRKFRTTFEELMARARAHFAAEEALLARGGYPDLDTLRNERDEFDYLAAEIITTENFDKDELQSFLALWWTGHILGSAGKQRAFFDAPSRGD
jgi:hemerythrin-like metal-binding protein